MKDSKKIEAFIHKHYAKMTNRELVVALKEEGVAMSVGEVQAILRKLGLSREIKGRGVLPSRIREIETLSITEERIKESDVYEKAIAEYESAREALAKKRYAQASKAFEEIAARYPQELELIDRVRVYGRICAQYAVAKQEAESLRTCEDFYTSGVLELNAKQYPSARKKLLKALEKAGMPKERGKAYYALASLCAKEAREDECFDFLGKAIKEEEKYRFQARTDMDFDACRENPDFRSLVTAQQTPSAKKA